MPTGTSQQLVETKDFIGFLLFLPGRMGKGIHRKFSSEWREMDPIYVYRPKRFTLSPVRILPAPGKNGHGR
jgi:hypothetical protein